MKKSNSHQIRIGQKVVCVNVQTPPTHVLRGIKKGEIYEVRSKITCPRCGAELIIIEGTIPDTTRECVLCLCSMHPEAFYSYRFKPVTFSIISNKEIINEIVAERLDSKKFEISSKKTEQIKN